MNEDQIAELSRYLDDGGNAPPFSVTSSTGIGSVHRTILCGGIPIATVDSCPCGETAALTEAGHAAGLVLLSEMKVALLRFQEAEKEKRAALLADKVAKIHAALAAAGEAS